jgi:hypothetical protein
LQLLVEARTADDFVDLVHVYPTMAEAPKVVAGSRFAVHGSAD